MTTTRAVQSSNNGVVLHLAFELSVRQWKLAFTTGMGQAPRVVSVKAGDLAGVLAHIARAKKRFQLGPEVGVVSVYEAGREGFWLHRWLLSVGVGNVIVDASSIEVKRRQRRAKNDQLDVESLVRLLVRYQLGEKKVWSVVHVPGEEDEDERQLHRELCKLKSDRTALTNEIKALLFTKGIMVVPLGKEFASWLQQVRSWHGQPLAVDLQGRLGRLYERYQLLQGQINALDGQLRKRIRQGQARQVELIRRLLQLRGVGRHSAWILVKELFGWRQISSRKQLGGLVGLTPTPYSSGTMQREQGISKAGNKRLRWLLVELGWCWVQYQPESALTRWFYQRFGEGPRLRRIGIVALARKLLIALWRYVERGEVPAGAQLTAWEPKVGGKASPPSPAAAEAQPVPAA